MKKITQILEAGADHVENKEEIIELLKSAFCEEMNAWYQYIVIEPFLIGNERKEISELYKETAKDELEDHGYWILERINQLGGEPGDLLNPDNWNKVAKHKYIQPSAGLTNYDVVASIQQNIEAEKGAIETYINLEKVTRDTDPVTNQKIKSILADEEEHLQSLQELLADIKK